MQLSSGQHRLQKISGVHRALCLPCTYDGMKFVDEKNDPSVALFYFSQHRLEPFLKFSTVLRAGDQSSHVE